MQKNLTGYTIFIDDTLEKSGLVWIAKNLKLTENSIKNAVIPTRPKESKKNLIQLLKNNDHEKVEIFPFQFKRRINFFADRIKVDQKGKAPGFVELLSGLLKSDLPRVGDAETDLWMDNMSEDHKDKFGMATSIQEQHDMDYITHIAELLKKTTAGGSPRKQIAQSPEEQNSQGEDEKVNESKTEDRPEKRNQKQQIITKFDDTPISVSDKSFAEQIEEQWENPPAPKQSGQYANSQTR